MSRRAAAVALVVFALFFISGAPTDALAGYYVGRAIGAAVLSAISFRVAAGRWPLAGRG